MAKGKAIIIGLFVLFALSASSQNEPKAERVSETELMLDVDSPFSIDLDYQLQSLKKVEPISADPKDQNKSINYAKSQEIISVKAYIRKLHMKRKETLMS